MRISMLTGALALLALFPACSSSGEAGDDDPSDESAGALTDGEGSARLAGPGAPCGGPVTCERWFECEGASPSKAGRCTPIPRGELGGYCGGFAGLPCKEGRCQLDPREQTFQGRTIVVGDPAGTCVESHAATPATPPTGPSD